MRRLSPAELDDDESRAVVLRRCADYFAQLCDVATVVQQRGALEYAGNESGGLFSDIAAASAWLRTEEKNAVLIERQAAGSSLRVDSVR